MFYYFWYYCMKIIIKIKKIFFKTKHTFEYTKYNVKWKNKWSSKTNVSKAICLWVVRLCSHCEDCWTTVSENDPVWAQAYECLCFFANPTAKKWLPNEWLARCQDHVRTRDALPILQLFLYTHLVFRQNNSFLLDWL